MAFHPSTCPFCACGCGMLLQEDRGRLVASYPAAVSPAKSSLCVRGWNCTSSWSHRDRLTQPMIRGAAGLVAATWRDAVEEIAGRLGSAAEPPLFALGPSLANEDAAAVRALARRTGGRTCATDLSGAAVARRALQRVLGARYGLSDVDEIGSADVVWVFGADPGDCPQVASRVVEARRRGAAVVHFDVHLAAGDRSRVVTLLPDRFGDVALLLQRAAFDAGLVTHAAREAPGFDEVARRWREASVSSDEPPIGLPQALSLAREIAAARRPAVVLGSRWLGTRRAEEHTVALLEALALLGAADRVAAAVGEANTWGVLDILGPDGARPAELACREDSLDTLLVIGDDLLRRSPRPAGLSAVLARLRTVVVIDRFVTDCLQFAHVVLPSCGFGEADGSVTSLFGRAQPWARVVEPPAACEPERVWMSRVGAALRMPSMVGEDAITTAAAGARLAFSPEYAGSVQEQPRADEAFGLRLMIGSVPANWSTGVVGQRDEILRREVVDSALAASPSTLKDAGVKAGWPVKVLVPGGEATVTARADGRLPPGVLVLVPLAGSPAAALRGSYPASDGHAVGLQPVPARIERAVS